MHLRPSNSLRRFGSTASADSSTAGMAPKEIAGPAAPIRKKKKPQTWLRNSLLRESEKQANRKGRPQKYLQNVSPEVFQRRGPPESAATAPAIAPHVAAAQDGTTQQPCTGAMSTIPALQSTAQYLQQQLAGTQIPTQLISSWPGGWLTASPGAVDVSSLANTCAQLQQSAPWDLREQMLKAKVLPSLSGNSNDSTASAFAPMQQQVQQQELLQPCSPVAVQSCGESNRSRQSSVPPPQQVCLVAALCGIYTSTSSKAPSISQQPHSSSGALGQILSAPVGCSSSPCPPAEPVSARSLHFATAEDRDCATADHEQFKRDGDGLATDEGLEGLGNIDQLVEEATGWDGDMLSCLLAPETSSLDQCASDSWGSLAGSIVRDVLASPQVHAFDSWDGCLDDVELSEGGWGPAMFLE